MRLPQICSRYGHWNSQLLAGQPARKKLGSWEWGIIIIMTKVLDPAGSSHIFSQFEGGLVYFRFQVGNLESHDDDDNDDDNDDNNECFM